MNKSGAGVRTRVPALLVLSRQYLFSVKEDWKFLENTPRVSFKYAQSFLRTRIDLFLNAPVSIRQRLRKILSNALESSPEHIRKPFLVPLLPDYRPLMLGRKTATTPSSGSPAWSMASSMVVRSWRSTLLDTRPTTRCTAPLGKADSSAAVRWASRRAVTSVVVTTTT